MKGIISVIVPVYNIREYLREAVDSVLKQDYQKLQVILIDDGSTDDSGKICDEYAQRDNRISVIHQKNGGAASAKNTGLKVAEGEYLAFLDSDDYLEEGAYSYMVKQLEDNKADAIQCCFRDIYVNESKERILFEGELEYDTMSYLKLYTQEWSCGLMTDKLYRRKLFDGIFLKKVIKLMMNISLIVG